MARFITFRAPSKTVVALDAEKICAISRSETGDAITAIWIGADDNQFFGVEEDFAEVIMKVQAALGDRHDK